MWRSKWVVWGAASLSLIGCAKKEDSSVPVVMHPVLSNRPIVAVVPVIDRCRTDLTWSVAAELSMGIRQRLIQRNHIYIANETVTAETANRILNIYDPFGLDDTWVKKKFPQTEFVVFIELLEHAETPLHPTQKDGSAPAELSLVVRLRTFDLRDQMPQVILQEVIQQTHPIPRQFTKINFDQVSWGEETFETSPLGIAHDALCKEIVSRIEEYIPLSHHR